MELNEKIEEYITAEGRGMQSAVGEYTPAEFFQAIRALSVLYDKSVKLSNVTMGMSMDPAIPPVTRDFVRRLSSEIDAAISEANEHMTDPDIF